MDDKYDRKDTATQPGGILLDRAELAQTAYRKAFAYDRQYGCCPQCVLAAIQETVGGLEDAVVKASHGLSGGGGLMGAGTCGALTGGLLALGSRYGRDRDKLAHGRGMNDFQKGRALVDRFRGEFRGVTCEDLQRRFTGRTYDLWNPGQYQAFSNTRGTQCAQAAGLVAQWVVEMLGDSERTMLVDGDTGSGREK